MNSEGRSALAELCAEYWYPVYAFIRRTGRTTDDAIDLTQAYFARLIERGTVSRAEPERGRFRAFLLADCRYFLADTRDRAIALKRGGGKIQLSLDAGDAETRYRLEPIDVNSPDRLFDRTWALGLLDRTMADVANHYERTNCGELFRAIQPVLAGQLEAPRYADIGRSLGMTAESVQVAVHRGRARFRETLRALVATTLEEPTPADVDDEIRGLFQALSS